MSRNWRYALGLFAALAIGGSAVAIGITLAMVADSHSQSSAIDARIDGSIAADAAHDSSVMAQIADDDAAAVTACEKAVRDDLKSPATAQIDVVNNDVGGPEGNLRGTVTGTVDSQNGFGALVRSDWTCIVPPGSSVDLMHATITSLIQRN